MAKRILLIGGNSGIGAALAAALQAQGHSVLSAHRSSDPPLNITDDQPAFPDVEDPLDGLVYLPGSINLKPFASLRPADFRSDLEINLLGAIKTLQHYQKALQAAENASVVLFSTVAVSTGMGFHASVAAAKGAVEGLTRSLAAEWAPRVRVNAVAPSLTDTPMATRLLRSEAQREASAKRHPLGRIGQPEDVAAAAAFLLSDESAWMTGQVLHVDGGMGALRNAN
jgi:NAD(P)-dependent dehydrogenase (short-subunit alcohol dehydrogenase family)